MDEDKKLYIARKYFILFATSDIELKKEKKWDALERKF